MPDDPGETTRRASLADVPEGQRWQIASRLAGNLPVLYDAVFRDQVGGEEFDRLERDIWIEVAKEARTLAWTYRWPVDNAGAIASTLSAIAGLFFGTEFKQEVLDLSPDTAVILRKRCPFYTHAIMLQRNPEHLFAKCLVFSVVTVEQLNPAFTLRFVRGSCMGDRQCELKVVRKDLVEERSKPPSPDKK